MKIIELFWQDSGNVSLTFTIYLEFMFRIPFFIEP